MKTKMQSAAKNLLALGMAGCAINALCVPVEKLEIAPKYQFSYKSESKTLNSGEQLIVARIGNGYIGLVGFDCEALKYAVKYRITKMDISLGIQYVEKSPSGKNPVVVEIIPLSGKLAEIKAGEAIDLKSLVDFSSPVLGQQELPATPTKGSVIVVPLAINDVPPEKLIEQLKNGIAIRLTGKGETEILQLNFYSDKTAPELAKCRMRLTVEFEPQTASLDIYPQVKPEPGKFVVRKGPSFFYNDKEIRFSGINFGDGNLSYEAIDNCVRRLRNMNINAIRHFASEYPFYTPESTAKKQMAVSVKGDNSTLDRYDYLVAKCQEAGIFIHNTSLGSNTPPMEFWPGSPVKIVNKTKTTIDHSYYTALPVLPYIDDIGRESRLAHIKMYLNRVNPYTNQRYADMPVFASWELANENHTVAAFLDGRMLKWDKFFKDSMKKRWNEYLKKKYSGNENLLKIWGKLDDGENLDNGSVEPGPIYSDMKKYPKARAADYIACVQNLFIETSKLFEAEARSCAKPGTGINIAPIVYNTHADLNFHAHYANSYGEIQSCGIYQTPYTDDKNKPFFPWKPIFSERPYYYNLNYQTSADKPMIVYEHSFFRPYPYRAEWIPAITLMGAGLGWDAIYLYIFGQQYAICGSSYSGPSFMSKPLPMPKATYHTGYTFGMHHGGDEVLMSTLALSSQAFINGIKPNRETTSVVFGKDAISNPDYLHYSPPGKTAVTSQSGSTIAGGEKEFYSMPNIYRKFMQSSVRSKLTVDFDEKQVAPIKVTGKFDEYLEDKGSLSPSTDVTWDQDKNRIVLDNAHSKIAVGILKDGMDFNDGVKLGRLNRDFAFFGISSRDGKPLAESDEIIVALTSNSHNTGFKFNPEKVKGQTLGHINGIENTGTAPVVVDRVSSEIDVPMNNMIMRCYNFAGYCYRETPVNGKISFTAEEPLFLALITRK
ncbi:MAG: hypothetical protein WCI51_14250 [Lentisphaerota bacterium]